MICLKLHAFELYFPDIWYNQLGHTPIKDCALVLLRVCLLVRQHAWPGGAGAAAAAEPPPRGHAVRPPTTLHNSSAERSTARFRQCHLFLLPPALLLCAPLDGHRDEPAF